MKQELQDNLCNDFPLLFKEGFYFECGNGWYELIRELCQKLYLLIENVEFEPHNFPNAYQVKEKYGGLKFYMSTATEEMIKLIEEAAKESTTICEMCGDEGELFKHKSWYSTLCDEHRNK